jgi:hypothetical protein
MSSNGPYTPSLDASDCSWTTLNGVASSVGAQLRPIWNPPARTTIGKKLEADMILSQASLRDRFLEYGHPLLFRLTAIAGALDTQRWIG